MLADCYRALRQWPQVEELWDELREASPDAELVTEGRIVMAGSLADRDRVVDAIRLLQAGWSLPEAAAAAPPAAGLRAGRPLRAGGRGAPGARPLPAHPQPPTPTSPTSATGSAACADTPGRARCHTPSVGWSRWPRPPTFPRTTERPRPACGRRVGEAPCPRPERPSPSRPPAPTWSCCEGCSAETPRPRQLPSGDALVAYDVTVRPSRGRRRPRAESVPVAWFDPPAAATAMAAGDDVVVVGRVRRRFFRAGGATAEPHRGRGRRGWCRPGPPAKVRAALAAALAGLEAHALGRPAPVAGAVRLLTGARPRA